MKTGYGIGQLSGLTGVKEGTIRFYERMGFLEKAQRRENGYRVFNERHVCQVKVCRLVFGGYVNRSLRRDSMELIRAAGCWNLEEYQKAAKRYEKAVEEQIDRTVKAIALCVERMETKDGEAAVSSHITYSKKQAAEMAAATPEAIRNWERNGLLPHGLPYQRRYYDQEALNRMYVIRLLLDTGYSMMAIRSYFSQYDSGCRSMAEVVLLSPGQNDDLIYRADRYLETLYHTKEKAVLLRELETEMRKI